MSTELQEMPVQTPFFTASCDELRERVGHALRQSGYMQLRRVHVSTRHGQVRLAGRVPTYHLKQVAQQTALGVEGVQTIENHLVVC
jgi:osmotically-inducible protein OsmY